MPLGTLKNVVVCGSSDSTTAVFTNAVGDSFYNKYVRCPDGTHSSVISTYVIDPSEAARFDAAFEPFDYNYASGLWTVSFSMVVGLYVVSRKLGAFLGFIRHG